MEREAKLPAVASGFTLAAAITILVNTVLACAKDASPPLKGFMKSIAGHDWTTQGLFDLALFVVLGLIFAKTRAADQIDAGRLVTILIASVFIASAGLALWYAFT
jgi:uncharacterized membrane protein SirB2